MSFRASTTRHPELVSGSIVPSPRRLREVRNCAASLPHRGSVAAEEWTLKQVQGEGNGEGAGRIGEGVYV